MNTPALHTVIPSFSLPDLQGHQISLWDYKHQQPVILVFCAEDGRTLLHDFACRYPAYRGEGAEVLAIMPDRPPEDSLPFPVLMDSKGRVAARLVEHLPAVLVLDSYNELYARFEGPWEEGPDHQAILEAVVQTELKCPECGVPEWPQQSS